jgi:Protein of unknown function (DUF1501)
MVVDACGTPNRAGWLNRRELLRAGGLGLFGIDLIAAARAAASGKEVTLPLVQSCILLFQPGGPGHVDTWDMKPDAPAEVRGEFKPIATSIPGLRFCEHLPRLARMADKMVVIRSIHHRLRDHNAAAVEALTGHTPLEPDGSIFADHANSFPCYGSALNYLKREQSPRVPLHVALPHVVTRGVKLPGQEPGFLGTAFGPFQVTVDANAPDYRVAELSLPGDTSLRRLEDRQSLRRLLDDQLRQAEHAVSTTDAYYERALSLLGSEAVHRAFDINREDSRVRDRYGRTKHGQSVLLARRLIEAGVRFVTVNFAHGDADIGGGDDWDTHFQNFSILRDITLPATDRAFSALIEDLNARGLLDSTLIVWMGEFGRTPRITNAEGGGRDHWPDCFSMVLAGGGIRGGTAYGSSDKIGAYPKSDPISPGELAATLFWRFGLDPATQLHDLRRRPYPLATGEPLRSLFI